MGRGADTAGIDEPPAPGETNYGNKMGEGKEKLMLTVSSLLMTHYGTK